LTEAERRAVLSTVLKRIAAHAVTPAGELDITALRHEHESAVLQSTTSDGFEQAVSRMLAALRVSHTGFFHDRRPRAAGRIAIAATFMKADTSDGARWMFQDVHPGGIAARAGIIPGDVLLTIDGQELDPTSSPTFFFGRAYVFVVRRANGSTVEAHIEIPGSREKRRPIIVPDQVVTAARIGSDTGLIRISMFPGILGIDVAREISRAIAELGRDRLIVDLRGNTGGGIGCLRLMSHFCADSRGVGYSVDARTLRRGYDKEKLPRFTSIPASKRGAIPLALRFAFRGRSVVVYSEGLGGAKHHGSIVLLVNEHSASAAEMVASFASEYRLATVVGAETAGRLVAASSFKVGSGYRVVLPVAAYFTWQDRNLEGIGVVPDIEVPLVADALVAGQDPQLARAVELLLEPAGSS
jgi:C-terminal processing protease CtpA/Prc